MFPNQNNLFSIDIHTHILPKNWPNLKERYGYGGFIHLEHHKPCCAKMMMDDRFFREVQSNLWDGQTRTHECNGLGVDVQVLSTVPVMFSYWAKPKDTLDLSQILNDHISDVVESFPNRFIGLGTLPMQSPDLAVQELERCINELGLAGVQIGSHINDWNLNEEALFPIYEAAQDLKAAIFVHPWDMMGQAEMKKYWLPWLVGMPAETSRAICSMIFGGVFEQFPNLKVAFAHGGGSFPATIGRVQHGFDVRPDLCAVDNHVNPRDYLGRFYIDSLVHDLKVLEYNIELFGADKIALGSDYPFPLGELSPGKLIKEAPFSEKVKKQLLFESALDWLQLTDEQLARIGAPAMRHSSVNLNK